MSGAHALPESPNFESNLRSFKGGASTFITFVNELDTPARIYWIDYGGDIVLYQTLSPQESCRQQTYVYHPWVILGRSQNDPVLVCHPSGIETQHVIRQGAESIDMRSALHFSGLTPSSPDTELSLRSTGESISTHVIFMNALPVSVHIYWIDFSGNRVLYKTLSSRRAYRQATYVHHPWVVCRADDDTAIAVFHPDENEMNALISEGAHPPASNRSQVLKCYLPLRPCMNFSLTWYRHGCCRLRATTSACMMPSEILSELILEITSIC